MKDTRHEQLVRAITDAPEADLTTPAFWEKLVRPHAPPWIGGTAKGKDPLVLQNPPEFGQFMAWLAGSGLRPRTFCEVGIFRGGVFAAVSAYLHRLGPADCVGVDTYPDRFREFAALKKLLPGIRLADGTAGVVRGRAFDLVHIDGDHSFRWVSHDYQAVGQFARTVFFHDVKNKQYPAPGLLWRRVRGRGDGWKEWTLHPMGGIGVMFNPRPVRLLL